MSKYECCGLHYDSPDLLTSHMRKDHNVAEFNMSLACCGSAFADAKQMSDHMKATHRIDMSVQV